MLPDRGQLFCLSESQLESVRCKRTDLTAVMNSIEELIECSTIGDQCCFDEALVVALNQAQTANQLVKFLLTFSSKDNLFAEGRRGK